ncbi:MAG: metal ABC transporter substrate-binding protein [Acidimicrobiales bacterium]|nr:metal ABC transporter substrate-binding protein [Acidimicrobiales bacterium]
MRNRRLQLTGLLAAIALGLLACGDDSTGEAAPPADDRPLIVATTSILGDVVSTLVGDEAEVEVVMPLGADPHDFEPSAQQAARLRDASLVVANGLGLEVGLDSTLDAAMSDGVTVLEVGELIDPLPFTAADHDEADHDEADHDHGAMDPHFWHDPIRMAEAVPGVVDAISDATGLDPAGLEERADALVADLAAVDDEVATILSVVPPERRVLVTNHDNLGYLAARYDFEVIGVIVQGGDSLASASPGDIGGLVHQIEEQQVPAVFAENVLAPTLSEALADEAAGEVEVVSLYTDSLGDPGSGAETYTGLLVTNAELIAEALG